MKKFMKIMLWVLLIVVLIGVWVLGYFGLVPGISAIFGSDQPRDLGVESGPEDFASVQAKLGQEIVEPGADPRAQLEAALANPVNTSITQEEYSEHVMQVHPVSDVQVRFDGDTFAVSGKIDKSRIPGFIETLGFTDVDSSEVLDAVNTYLPGDAIFYMTGTALAENDAVTLSLTNAEIGRFGIDPAEAEPYVAGYLEMVADAIPAFNMESITIRDGEMHFSGTAPAELPRY